MMEEIYKNKYFNSDHRLKQVQEVMDLMHDNFPECGLPQAIAVTHQWIVISSRLGTLYQGSKHADLDSNMSTSNRICIYDRNTRELKNITDWKYPVNDLLIINNSLLAACGVWGQIGGELLQYSFETKQWRTCSDNQIAFSQFILDNGKLFVLASPGDYERIDNLYALDTDTDFFINYSTKCDVWIPDLENESNPDPVSKSVQDIIRNNEKNQIPVNSREEMAILLKKLLNNEIPGASCFNFSSYL